VEHLALSSSEIPFFRSLLGLHYLIRELPAEKHVTASSAVKLVPVIAEQLAYMRHFIGWVLNLND
jgi:hypothetical protein